MMPAPRLKDLVLLARQQADQEVSKFCNDREVTVYLNNGVSSLHDLVVQKYEDYIAKEITWDASISPNGEYTFEQIGLTDFYKSLGLDIVIGDVRFRLRPYMFSERNRYDVYPGLYAGIGSYGSLAASQYHILGDKMRIIPRPIVAGTFSWFYVPTAFQFDWTNPEQELGFNYAFAPGWEEYITVYAAIRMVRKEEGMTRLLDEELMRLKRRIEEAAGKRDAGESWAIADVRTGSFDEGYPFSPWGFW